MRIAGKDDQEILNEAVQRSLTASVPLISVETAYLLFTLARAASPVRIAEIGTGFGYSALLLALASPGSSIITIENDAQCAKPAQEFFTAMGVCGRVSLLSGNAIVALRTVSGLFDFAFIDAAKEEYVSYLNLLLTRLARGAILVADDVFFDGKMHGKLLPKLVREQIRNELEHFRRIVREKPYFLTSFLPIGCGVSVTLLIGHPELEDVGNGAMQD